VACLARQCHATLSDTAAPSLVSNHFLGCSTKSQPPIFVWGFFVLACRGLSERGLLGTAVPRHIERQRGAVSCEQSLPWLLHNAATADFCLGVFCFGVSRIVGAWLAWHGSVTPH
jgi:hypothetical protein